MPGPLKMLVKTTAQKLEQAIEALNTSGRKVFSTRYEPYIPQGAVYQELTGAQYVKSILDMYNDNPDNLWVDESLPSFHDYTDEQLLSAFRKEKNFNSLLGIQGIAHGVSPDGVFVPMTNIKQAPSGGYVGAFTGTPAQTITKILTPIDDGAILEGISLFRKTAK